MKVRNFVSCVVALFLMLLFGMGRGCAADVSSVKITPLAVSDVKWVYLQFSSDVKYADRGTDDIFIEISKIPSIVRIKSEVAVFDPTSVTLITLDGIVHTFRLEYEQDPQSVAYKVLSSGLSVIPPYDVELSHRQTSHIVFSSKVLEVQTGTEKLIAMKAEEIDNIVKCKSLTQGFDYFTESSLTVLTDDGTVHPFLVRYKEYPELVNIQVSSQESSPEAIFSSLSINEPEMRTYAKQVLNKGCVLRNIGDYRDKMSFSIYGIYVKEDVMMFYLNMENLSKVDYEVDFIKNYIVNKKTTKKQAYQADEKIPLFVYEESENQLIPAGESKSVVLFFKRFTIPRKHNMYFELFERNGGRHLKFTLSNKTLLDAKKLTKD